MAATSRAFYARPVFVAHILNFAKVGADAQSVCGLISAASGSVLVSTASVGTRINRIHRSIIF